jgi:hypothetical protein
MISSQGILPGVLGTNFTLILGADALAMLHLNGVQAERHLFRALDEPVRQHYKRLLILARRLRVREAVKPMPGSLRVQLNASEVPNPAAIVGSSAVAGNQERLKRPGYRSLVEIATCGAARWATTRISCGLILANEGSVGLPQLRRPLPMLPLRAVSTRCQTTTVTTLRRLANHFFSFIQPRSFFSVVDDPLLRSFEYSSIRAGRGRQDILSSSFPWSWPV